MRAEVRRPISAWPSMGTALTNSREYQWEVMGKPMVQQLNSMVVPMSNNGEIMLKIMREAWEFLGQHWQITWNGLGRSVGRYTHTGRESVGMYWAFEPIRNSDGQDWKSHWIWLEIDSGSSSKPQGHDRKTIGISLRIYWRTMSLNSRIIHTFAKHFMSEVACARECVGFSVVSFEVLLFV